jgi:hypothetical protein
VDQSSRYASYLSQFDGRSLFFIPSPPPPPHVDVPRETGPTETPKPTRYGGPSLIALINDTAWFSDGRRLAAGADKDGSLRVIRVEAPWNAVVEWQEVEFTVSLFDRDQVVWKEGRPALPETPAAAPEPPAATVAEQPAGTPAPSTTEAPSESTTESQPATPASTSAEAPPPSDATTNGSGNESGNGSENGSGESPNREQP